MRVMTRRPRLWSAAAVVAAVAVLALTALQTPELRAQPTGPATYTVVDYGPLGDQGAASVVRRINSLGEVAGGFRRPGSAPLVGAVIVGPRASTPLVPDSDYSVAYGLNDRGEVAGSFNTDTAMRPFRSVRREAFLELPLLPGDNGGAAYAINGSGVAVGSSTGGQGERAVAWTRAGDVRALAVPAGAGTSRAVGVNDRGDVVGVVGDDPRQAALWPHAGPATVLPTLPGYRGADAAAVDETGSVVGFALGAADAPERARAVMWAAGGSTVSDLGVLPGGRDSRARDVGAGGQVVGVSSSEQGDRAFVWTVAGGMVDLNTLVSAPDLLLTDAVAVNRNGAILAVAVDRRAGGTDHGAHAAEAHGGHDLPRRVVVLEPVR